MKRLFAVLLVLSLVLTVLAGCGTDADQTTPATTTTGAATPDPITTEYSFVAGYEKEIDMGGTVVSTQASVLMNLYSDNTAEIYIGYMGMGGYSSACYEGTYTMTPDLDELDLSLTYTYTSGEEEQTATIDTTLVGFSFDASVFLIASFPSEPLTFYEIPPVTLGEGDGYVGILVKTTGMGEMIYAYYLEMNGDNTFTVAALQHAAVMHIAETQNGTYTRDGETVVFTYDVMGDGEVQAEDHTSTCSDFAEQTLTVGFNVGQAGTPTTPAPFIKVK